MAEVDSGQEELSRRTALRQHHPGEAEAEPLLLKGYEGPQQHEECIPANSRQIRVNEALVRLVQLYEETNKPAEAAKWRKELEAVRRLAEGRKP